MRLPGEVIPNKTCLRARQKIGIFASRLHHIFNRSSIANVLEIARYSCGFAQSDRLNLRQIRAQILQGKVQWLRSLRNGDETVVYYEKGYIDTLGFGT